MWIPEHEYRQIVQRIPVPCVDLIVKNPHNEVMLVKRNNEPARGDWWFPGGRVFLGETRHQAAERKLIEECGLVSTHTSEWKTFDIFLRNATENYVSHAVSTFFVMQVNQAEWKLDAQSSDARWKKPNEWEADNLNEFVRNIMTQMPS